MKATSIDTRASLNDAGHPTGQVPEVGDSAAVPGTGAGKPESELRATALRHGLTMKELADRMGVSASYLSQVATGRRPWSPAMRERVVAVLGEVLGQGVVYLQGGVVQGESSYIRERARALGMSMGELADRVGVSRGYITQVSRGRRRMGVKVQARVAAALNAQIRVESAKPASVDCRVLWERMDAPGISQNEVARRAGVNSAHLSNITNGKASPSGGVLKKLYGCCTSRLRRNW